MEITIKNSQLAPTANMLLTIDCMPKNAIAISKMVRLISIKNDEYADDEIALAKLFCEIDELGNLKNDKDGNLVAKEGFTISDFLDEQTELKNTNCVIDLKEFKPYLPKLKKALNEVTNRMAGEQLIAYATLLEKLEEVQDES